MFVYIDCNKVSIQSWYLEKRNPNCVAQIHSWLTWWYSIHTYQVLAVIRAYSEQKGVQKKKQGRIEVLMCLQTIWAIMSNILSLEQCLDNYSWSRRTKLKTAKLLSLAVCDPAKISITLLTFVILKCICVGRIRATEAF